jgi:hypothetical protein
MSVASLPRDSPVIFDGPDSETDTPSPDPTSPLRGGEEETDNDGPTPVQDDPEPASTPPESSAKSIGLRRSAKRKSKQPFFSQQEEGNAIAFAELPLDEAVSPPMPRRSNRALLSAQGAIGPSAIAQRAVVKTSKKRPATDSAVEESDHSAALEQSGYRSGPLSRTEQNQITAAVNRFREDESLTEEEIIHLIHQNPQISEQAVNRQLWISIQDACPTRPRRKLIAWCRQRFHNFAARGVWTKEQDDELADLVEKHGKRWSYIAGLINRHQKDARDRWRNYLVCRDNAKTDVWSEDEEDHFREVVEHAIEKIRERLSGNSRKSPEELINWLKISEEMDHTRSRLQCMEKWRRMRAAEPLADKIPTVLPPGSSWRLEKARKELRALTADDKYRLMSAVLDSRVGTDARIRWKSIVSDTFRSKYERQTLVVAWGRLRKAVPDWQWKTTRDCARYLCDMYEREGNFGATDSGDDEGIEHSLPQEPSASTKSRRSKGKEVVPPPPAADPSASASLHRAPDGKKSNKDREPAAVAAQSSNIAPVFLRSKRGKSQSQTKNDAGAEDETPIKPPTKKRPQQVEKEASPELGILPPTQSPTVEVQAARSRRRERRASPGEEGEARPANGKEEEVPPHAPEVSKRPRRGSLADGGNVEGPMSKRQKTSKTSAVASKSKVNRVKVGKTVNDSLASRPEKSWSVVSSDMDDMEDIPATLPWSSQVAR